MTVYEHDDQGLRIIGYNQGIYFYDPTRTLQCQLYLTSAGKLASNCEIATNVGTAPEANEYVRLDGNNWASWQPDGGMQSVVGHFNLAGAYEYRIGSLHALSMPGTRNLAAGDGAGAELIAGGADNVLIGYQAGSALTTGANNVLIGANVAPSLAVRSNNVIIGYNSFPDATYIMHTVAIGREIGEIITGGNVTTSVIIGDSALWNTHTKTYVVDSVVIGVNAMASIGNDYVLQSVAIGGYVGEEAERIWYSVAIGERAAFHYDGEYSVFVGWLAGYEATTAEGVVAVGANAGHSLTTGDSNTLIGTESGYTLTTGVNNVFLGFESGYYETGSNKLFIDNAARANEADARVKALVYGIFDAATANQYLTVNGHIVGLEKATFTGGLSTLQSVANYSDPPTDAELDAAFGTPATLGRGFVALLDDNDADTDSYIVWTSDASWYYIKATKAA